MKDVKNAFRMNLPQRHLILLQFQDSVLCEGTMSKTRKQIPKSIKIDVMFLTDSTCCVCRVRGKPVQIHHIDKNSSNNTFENLAVLCQECHNDAHIQGGFGQKLDAHLVTKYRDEWLKDVKLRRNSANERAIEMQVGEINKSDHIKAKLQSHNMEHAKLKKPSLAYINSLPAFKSALLQQGKSKRDSGITSEMVQASYDYIDSLTGILVTLANYYSPEQFGDQSLEEFFSEIIASRFRWHYTVNEPYGPGTGGTIVRILCAGGVAFDVEKMIEDMIFALVGYDDDFDYGSWKKRWRQSSDS